MEARNVKINLGGETFDVEVFDWKPEYDDVAKPHTVFDDLTGAFQRLTEVAITWNMQMTKYGRKFFMSMFSQTPAIKKNKRYGYGR